MILQGKVARRKLATSLGHLALLLRSSIPITTSLQTLSVQEECLPLRKAWEDVLCMVETGHKLSGAMTKHPTVFPSTVVLMVRAGEESGMIDDRLQRAADMVERQAGYEEKLRQAMSGPMVTLGFSLLVLFILCRFVMPRFTEMYSSMNVKLPWITAIAVGAVNFLNDPVFPAFLLLGVAAVLSSRDRLKSWLFRVALEIPFTRPLVSSLLCAQFCDTIGSLYSNGIPIPRAVRLLAASTWEMSYSERLERVASRTELDGDLSLAVNEEIEFFPVCLGAMLVVGAETGALESVLHSVQRLMDMEAESRLEVCLAMTEPLMVGGLGLFLAGFFVAMLLPMYQLVSQLSP